MRITRLDLLRYGKFTDKSVLLPSAAKDFHLIVGPNEAGKSTLRNAVQDLLFGIETRSRYNFLHPHSEMRLGALIEHGDDRLDFIRTKARTKTLQSSTGTPLPDNALTPFLGQIDRAFFDQMFGLNHERLVTGGQEILSASNDIGQILFQAAAGIGNLGEIRDRLEAEADQLWAKRKSGEREYYIASAELEQAEAALKQATVRTKDWQEARTKVDQVGDDLKLAQEQYRTLEQERIQLERVRRVAPMLTSLAELERQLAVLGEVVSLPDNSADQFANAEHEIAIATPSLMLFEKQAVELQERIEALRPDESILARGADIEALSAMRQQLRNHESDIGKREEEVRVLWQSVEESMRQLGWPEQAEDALAQRLPGSLARSALDNLVRRHEALEQALSAAEEVLRSRGEEAKAVNAEIDALPATEIPVTLVDALATARSLGDVATQEKRIETQIARLKRELETTAHELGEWNPGTDSLRKLLPPSQDEMNALIKGRNDLELTASTTRERLAEAKSEVLSLQLEISQYKAAHHPVTLADVQQVRAARDSTWQSIKTGSIPLKDAAPGYEKEVAESDTLSDKRHDKAQEETELQSRLDRLLRLQQHMTDFESRLQENMQLLTHLDQDWEDRIKGMELAGMPLLKVNDWRSARERVLSADTALLEAQSTQADFVASVAHARSALTDTMLAIKPEALNLNLSALILLADEVVNTATRVQERRNTLANQKIRAEAAIPELNNRVGQARAAIDTWRTELQKNLALAHLPADANAGAIAGALALFERMDQHLQKIRDLRVNRIDMMRRDLNHFADAAQSLAVDVAPAMTIESAAQIAIDLESRLKQALSASQERGRLKAELDKAAEQATAARSRIAEAKASLQPLFHFSGTIDNDSLRAAIISSDRQRLLTSEMDQAIKQLLQAGDGMGREILVSEFEASDASTTSIRLSEIKLLIDEVVGQQNRLSGELNSAEATLGKIAGQDEAARAESQRQEALARMSNAAERYIKVYTAAKLLRWSIERFRESKQGPMLARASEVYSGLTQGAFNKLVVDYESEPLKLSGQRATGELVDIEGMSEGSRDQLYLALRLAALELHLEQTVPLPFIADDLFINYDDGRAKAGLDALAKLSEMTQVIFLTHHEHLVPVAQSVFGEKLNVLTL
ncbi:MAG: AAA family ATPase [Sulfurimicrobium sp.]|nr:AAA family ATPase [Sulfurimicrobium sp.]